MKKPLQLILSKSRFYFVFLIFVSLSSCTSKQVKELETSTPVTEPVTVIQDSGSSADENIDVDGLKRFLGMNRRFSQLGYSEKKFNTCEVGYGYSSVNRCRPMHMVVLNYRLQCRDSEGTVNQIVTAQNLRPISLREVKWTLKGMRGQSRTDSEG